VSNIRDQVEDLAGLKRVRYFSGQLLTAADFRDEQQYWIEIHRRHNRLLHGWGIVTGLGLSTSSGGPLTVEPGLALDPLGREVSITAPVTVPVKGAHSSYLVAVSYCERETDPVPTPGESGDAEPSRVEEGASVSLAKRAEADSVVIGRIVRRATGWKIDRAFRPRRVHR
jgi:hypothetical protein